MQRSVEQLANVSAFDYENAKEPEKKDFLTRFKLIRKKKVSFPKPIAAIYNPMAGRGNDVRSLINIRLELLDVKVEYFETKHKFHAYELARTLPFQQYSALIVIGGDGTISEVVNGLFARRDRRTLPLGLVPNGASNDICLSLGIKSFDQGLDFILKRETLPIDSVRVLLDRDSEAKLPEGPERMSNCRYMMAGSCLSMPAKIASTAKSWGFCSCASSLVSFYKGVSFRFEEDNYKIAVDSLQLGDQHGQETVSTGLLVVSNGKYINGGAMFNPYSVINDGLIDIAWVHDPAYAGYWGLSGLMKKASSYGGTHTFDGNCSFLRGRSIKLEYRGKKHAHETDEKCQTVIIDNEDVHFESSIQFDSGEGFNTFKVDILIDTDTYFTEHNAFVVGHNQMINPKEFKEGQLQRIVTKLQSYKDHPEILQAQI